MIKVDAFFISGTLLKKEPCVKFMLKHEIKNYFRQFTKSKSNYVWREQLNGCVKYWIFSDKNIRFIG